MADPCGFADYGIAFWYNSLMDRKRALGQFFTKGELWLRPQVFDFIKLAGCDVAYDPFAGEGDLLTTMVERCGFREVVGLDIDKKLKWRQNDSLLEIPHVSDAIIITNPPYLTNYSAARKGLGGDLRKYFDTTDYTDLYMLALDKMLEAQRYVVAIVPETFINSRYRQKKLLHNITILEDNPFDDTENPVVVACFDGREKSLSEVKVYKNDEFVNSLGTIERLRIRPKGSVEMTFNDPAGWLAVRCVDTTNPNNMIRFDMKENIDYDWEHRIKVSSRLLTLVDLDVPESDRVRFVGRCNSLLLELRRETSDIILSPFKGNMKNGRRRRRLDFMTCRAIIERAYTAMYEPSSPLEVAFSDTSDSMVERILDVRQQTLL